MQGHEYQEVGITRDHLRVCLPGCLPERLHMASQCGLASSRHGSLKEVGFLTWWLRAPSMSILMNKMEAALSFMLQSRKSLNITCMVVYWLKQSGVHPDSKRRELDSSSWGGEGKARCRRACGMRDIVVAISELCHTSDAVIPTLW